LAATEDWSLAGGSDQSDPPPTSTSQVLRRYERAINYICEFADEDERVHVDLQDKDDIIMDVYRQQWTLLAEYMLEENLFPTAKTVQEAQIYAEKKKAVLNLARSSFRSL